MPSVELQIHTHKHFLRQGLHLDYLVVFELTEQGNLKADCRAVGGTHTSEGEGLQQVKTDFCSYRVSRSTHDLEFK